MAGEEGEGSRDSEVQGVRQMIVEYLSFLDESKSEEDRADATLFFRKYSCRCKNVAADLFEDLVKGLIASLHSTVDTTRLDAAWALTNFACESHNACAMIVKHRGVHALSACARFSRGEIQDQAFWAIGNIASDCQWCRNQVRSTDAVRTMIDILDALTGEEASFPPFSFNLLWALSQSLRNGMHMLPLLLVRKALRALARLLAREEPHLVKAEAVMSIAHLADDHFNGIDEVLQTPGVLGILHSLLWNAHTVQPALRAIGNIVAGDDQHTQAVIDAGTLPLLVRLYNDESTSDEVHRQLLWIVSNVAAGTAQQINQLFDGDSVVPLVLEAAFSSNLSKRCEAGWVIVNALAGSDARRMKWLCANDMLRALGSVVNGRMTHRLRERVLNAVQVVLRRRPEFVVVLRRHGIMDVIHQMASANEFDLSDRAAEVESIESSRAAIHPEPFVYDFS